MGGVISTESTVYPVLRTGASTFPCGNLGNRIFLLISLIPLEMYGVSCYGFRKSRKRFCYEGRKVYGSLP
jgi:hypothetical protein